MTPARETDVIILCGGLGTRLGSAAEGRPKPMVLVGKKPFLEILVDWAVGQGFGRFILCAGYKAEMIRGHFCTREGREFVVSEEKSPLGTGGALKLCAPLRKSEASLVLNGDSFCDVEVQALLDLRVRHDSPAVIAFASAHGRKDGGYAALADDGRIASFAEKDPTTGPWINAGVSVLGPEVFAAIPEGACSLERDVLPGLLKKNLYGLRTTAALYDIGTPERLEAFRAIYKE
jgi:NDP-sugar pyrophosphorylase family protein